MRFATVRIDQYMTAHPHSVGAEQSMATAHNLMRDHHIRHLPVLHGGQLVGIVTQRDLFLMESLKDVNPEEVSVEEAMSQEVYAVAPSTTLAEVAATMAEKRFGCAVIMDQDKVVGIFSTVDALTALNDLVKQA